MKVQYMSDLHLEFGDMPIPEVVGDVLVLAGDIHVGADGVNWINAAAKQFKYVIYILGNHEFYHNDMPALISYLSQDHIFDKNVHFLDNDTVILDGVKFVGTTLWSNVEARAFYAMNDSRIIKYDGSSMPLFKVKEMFEANMQFLHENSDADVVVTHQCPHIKSINTERYPDDSMNTGYYTDIIDQFRDTNIKHWICGHTHSAVEYVEANITVHNNCRGYVSAYGKGVGGCEVEDFNPSAYFDVC